MRINEYNSLDEFIYEYDSGRASSKSDTEGRKFMGIEFSYKGVYYRVCREPIIDDTTPIEVKEDGRYNITIMHCKKFGYPIADNFESIGWYDDIYELLEKCIIDGVKFKEIIMDDSTEILSKD